MSNLLKLLSILLLTALGLYLARLALPLFAPFLLSLAFAVLMEPLVSALHRRGVRRSLAAGLITAMVLFVAAGALSGLAAGGAHVLTSYARQAPELLLTLTRTVDNVELQLTRLLGAAPAPVAQRLHSGLDVLTDQLSELPLWLSRQALSWVTAFAKASPDWLLFACTAMMGIYFFSRYYPELTDFVRRQFPPAFLARVRMVRQVTKTALGGYLKVQCVLSAITFCILLPAMMLLQVDDPWSAAAGIALVDALPILGSGIVLLPWALIALASGSTGRAMGLVTVYGVLLVSHNLLQPKLMGNQLGLHPITALVSLYMGWKLAGLVGMLALPVLCVLLTGLNDAGVIKLYR